VGLLLSAPRAGDIGRSQAPVISSKCGQCHVSSGGTRPDTGLFYCCGLSARRVCSTATDFQCDTITSIDRFNCQSQYYVCDGEDDCLLDSSDENSTKCDARVCQVRQRVVATG